MNILVYPLSVDMSWSIMSIPHYTYMYRTLVCLITSDNIILSEMKLVRIL